MTNTAGLLLLWMELVVLLLLVRLLMVRIVQFVAILLLLLLLLVELVLLRLELLLHQSVVTLLMAGHTDTRHDGMVAAAGPHHARRGR